MEIFESALRGNGVGDENNPTRFAVDPIVMKREKGNMSALFQAPDVGFERGHSSGEGHSSEANSCSETANPVS
jgi:hypothetical protein